MNRQHNGQKKKDKRKDNTWPKEKGQKERQHMAKRKRTKGKTNNDLQNTTQKTKDRAT
jgi:hypothetical protein